MRRLDYSICERYGIIGGVITCRKMNATEVHDAFHMLSDFLTADEHYLASSQAYGDLGVAGLNNALDLFLEHPELGFVWMAYDENGVAGICVVCYAISTSMGSVMPSYPHLLSNDIPWEVIQPRVNVMAMLNVPYDAQALAHADSLAMQQAEAVARTLVAAGGPKGMETKEVIALIAYLQRLGRDIQLAQDTPGGAR